MIAIHLRISSALMVGALVSAPVWAAGLSVQQRTELAYFGLRAMGLNVGIEAVRNVPTEAEIRTMVATGINGNGHVCAEVVSIIPLGVPGAYEVRCVMYRGGQATGDYLVDAMRGVASEM